MKEGLIAFMLVIGAVYLSWELYPWFFTHLPLKSENTGHLFFDPVSNEVRSDRRTVFGVFMLIIATLSFGIFVFPVAAWFFLYRDLRKLRSGTLLSRAMLGVLVDVCVLLILHTLALTSGRLLAME